MNILHVFTTVTCFAIISNAYPYNDHKYFMNLKNPYPANCCQLEWTDINQGDSLPANYVEAGIFLNRSWAFIGADFGKVSVKSNISHEYPNWISDNKHSWKVNPYPILTNPNKCHTGWYTTKYNAEKTPKNSDWFFPPLSPFETGDFARLNGAPSHIYGSGYLDTINSLYGYKETKPKHYDLLYVDCKKSPKVE